MEVELELVAGRECGPCNACCIYLTIDDPELQKPQGFRCRNNQKDGRCGIYDDRPHACQTFFCGWRRLKWMRDTLRPDMSGVLVRLHYEVSRIDESKQLGVVFTLLTNAALKAEGLAEAVAAAVAANVPVYLNVPGPPGQTSAQGRINEALAEAVAFKDKAAVLEVLRRARAQGKHGERATITFDEKKGATARRSR